MFLPTTFQEGAGNGLRSDLLRKKSLSFCRRQLKNATHRRELIISKKMAPVIIVSFITHHSPTLTSWMSTLWVIFGCYAHHFLLFYNFACPPRRNQVLRIKRIMGSTAPINTPGRTKFNFASLSASGNL